MRLIGTLLLLALNAGTAAVPSTAGQSPTIEQRAKAGDPEAQFALGQFYTLNSSVGLTDPERAERWYLQAAAQDHFGAILALVDLYTMYPQLSNNEADLANLLEKAAAHGNLTAGARLGKLYWTGGRALKINRPKGYSLLRNAAISGNEDAIIFLAGRAFDGEGVLRDKAIGRRLLEWGRSKGSVVAAMHLATMREEDDRLEPIAKVTRKLEKAAKGGNATATRVLGRALESGLARLENQRDESLQIRFTWAREYYVIAAKQGDAEAAGRLGSLFLRGLGGAKDAALAREYFQRAATAGDHYAQWQLALMLAGESRGQESSARIVELLQAASVILPEAMFSLGMLHYDGKVVPKNIREAATLFEQAAHRGSADACINLGVIAANGELLETDYCSAVAWWTIAGLSGARDAGRLIAKISPRLSSADWTKIQQRVLDWQSRDRSVDGTLVPELQLLK
jgi:TPR repeat protein